MSIHFISGKPGGGKTLYSVKLIVEELVRSNRCIITNVPLLLPRLNEYLQQNYPKLFEERFTGEQLRHISSRIILLDEDDLPKFFTYRPDDVRLESVSNQEWKAGKRPDFSQVKDGGVLYVLDEVHIAFNARAWAETGHEVLYYLSQHRKLGDDVICITQAIGNVDKQFRSVAQDFTYLRNLSKQRAGLFRLPAMFIRSTYAQPATDNSKAMETGTFKLDVSGLASCYDTARGVGIHGRTGADTNSRKKGFHWLWFVIGLPLIVWALLHYLPILTVRYMNPHNSPPAKTLPAKQTAPEMKLSDTNGAPTEEKPPATHKRPVTYQPQDDDGQDLYCVGYTLLFGHPKVFLSDGSEWEEPDVTQVTKHTVTINAVVYAIKPHRERYQTQRPEYQPEPDNEYRQPYATASRPVNEAIILPAIHGQGSSVPPRLNGISSMQRMSPGGRQVMQNA